MTGTIVGQPFFRRSAVAQRRQAGSHGQNVLPALLVVGVRAGEIEAKGGHSPQFVGQATDCPFIHRATGPTEYS